MTTQSFKVSRQYPVHQFENWISQTEELIQTIPQENNVLFWGAKGNDINDDTAAFNAALAGDCPIFVPMGTYLINGTITIPTNHELVGLCKAGSVLHFTGSAANYDGVIMNNSCVFANLSTTYTGSNSTTSTAISIVGNNSYVKDSFINLSNLETQTAFGVGFDSTTIASCVYASHVHGVVSAVRFTALAIRTRLTNCTFNCGASGTAVNFTNAGGQNVITTCVLRGNSGATVGIDTGAASITSVANNYSVVTAITGAGLTSSTVVDNLGTLNFNTTAAYNVDGVKVVGNRSLGYTITAGASVLTRTLPTGDMTAAQLTNVLKQLVIDLGLGTTNTDAGGHGLLSTAYTA